MNSVMYLKKEKKQKPPVATEPTVHLCGTWMADRGHSALMTHHCRVKLHGLKTSCEVGDSPHPA